MPYIPNNTLRDFVNDLVGRKMLVSKIEAVGIRGVALECFRGSQNI